MSLVVSNWSVATIHHCLFARGIDLSGRRRVTLKLRVFPATAASTRAHSRRRSGIPALSTWRDLAGTRTPRQQHSSSGSHLAVKSGSSERKWSESESGEMEEEGSSWTSGYKEYVAGLLAGVATVATGHPFDTVKVKLQKHNTEGHMIQYRSGLHCTARILKTEGIKGLYRGATSSFVGMAFESSLLFGIYSQTKMSLQGGVQSGEPQPQVIIPSAAYGGAIISFVLCPTELVKCRMQIQGTDSLVPKSSRYSSPLECALKTVKTDGVTGIFRGGCTTLLRESLGNAVFFSIYEYVRYHMHSHVKAVSSNYNSTIDIGIGIVTGGLAGVGFWLAVLPLDVAKTLIQTSPHKNCPRNPFQVLSSIYRSAGLKGCYTGLAPTVTRAFPANAAAIVTWELAMKILGIRHD